MNNDTSTYYIRFNLGEEMTSYKIQVGYTGMANSEEEDAYLIKCAEEIRNDPESIVQEVLKTEIHAVESDVREVANVYPKREDLSMVIGRQNGRAVIRQFSSGSGNYRVAKCMCRRAVCRLMMRQMHRNGLEVDVFVS